MQRRLTFWKANAQVHLRIPVIRRQRHNISLYIIFVAAVLKVVLHTPMSPRIERLIKRTH